MKEYTREEINHLLDSLETGELRVTEKNSDGTWVVHSWIKEAILAAFRLGVMTDMSQGAFPFYDKDTVPVRRISPQAGIRIVPGGSSIRRGAFVASSVVVMPPSYINIGAYVDEGTMVDSHALVGSCAQIGKHVHLSAASQVGGRQCLHRRQLRNIRRNYYPRTGRYRYRCHHQRFDIHL